MEDEPDAGDNLDHRVALMTDDISLEQDQLETRKEALDNRPRNTLKSYESKKKEFVAWMHSKTSLTISQSLKQRCIPSWGPLSTGLTSENRVVRLAPLLSNRMALLASTCTNDSGI